MAANYLDIVKQISIKQFMPIYVFMGEEPYYIDALTDLLEASILTDDEKIMNESIIYGKETSIAKVVMEARQYPVMANYRVIYLKEAQTMGAKEDYSHLEKYLQNPLSSTILVITYKGGTIDKRKAWIKQADKLGVVFSSDKIKENQLKPEIEHLANQSGLDIEEQATDLLVEYIGSDLTQLHNTMERFSIMLGNKSRTITTQLVEKVVGISKDYNVFELINALFDKDVRKANLIIRHTSDVVQKIVPTLYNAYSNLLIYQYLPTGLNNNEVAAKLNCSPYAVWSYKKAATKYTRMQTFKAIGYLRQLDIKSKGVDSVESANPFGLLNEAIYKIMH